MAGTEPLASVAVARGWDLEAVGFGMGAEVRRGWLCLWVYRLLCVAKLGLLSFCLCPFFLFLSPYVSLFCSVLVAYVLEIFCVTPLCTDVDAILASPISQIRKRLLKPMSCRRNLCPVP